MVSMYETSSATSDLTEGSILQVSWSRMSVQAQGIVSDTTQLSRIIDSETHQAKQTMNLLIFALMGAFVTFLFISSFLFSRRIWSLSTISRREHESSGPVISITS